jgi:putative zinc finger protein
MTDCDRVMEFISDYIEKRLTPGLKTELDNHFQQCPDCKLVLERIPKVQSLMGNLASVKCSEDFNLKLREKVAGNQNESMISSGSFKKVTYGFSFAIFIFAIVFGFNFFNQADTAADIQLPQVQKQEAIVPSNTAHQNIQQASTNLTHTDELDVRTKESEGIYSDSAKTKSPDVKDPRVKYVDTK